MPASPAPPVILVADDEPDLRDSLTAALTLLGYRAEAVSSAGEVMARLAAWPRVNVLISDIAMPGGSGIDLACAVQQLDPAEARPAVLLMSGHLAHTGRVMELPSVVVEVLEKPFQLSALQAALRRALARPPA